VAEAVTECARTAASCAFSPLSDYSFAHYDRLVSQFDVLRARGQADGRCSGVRQSSNTLDGCTNPDLISNVQIEDVMRYFGYIS
jgi:hypothetical protein